MPSLLDRLSREECWEAFYEYKTSMDCPGSAERELRGFINGRGYMPVCEAIYRHEPFPLPKRTEISKLGKAKKRVVYTYPPAENTVLKLLTYLMLRKYDGLFAGGLYSFRPGRSAKDAVRRLRGTDGIAGMYSYKADISNYFNSVPVPLLLPKLEEALGDDGELFAFLSSLLEEPFVTDGSGPVRDEKGIMAGTPLSSFYANLYLEELDRYFEEINVPYARYSDDIILFAPSREETERHAEHIRAFLADRGLTLNPEKEFFSAPEEGWTFLGFRCVGDTVDIAPATVTKLKKKMRRKARALSRWSDRNGVEKERAAKAFIRIFNRKLLESPADNELTWSYWFFSVINTPDSLREIDRYAQDCIRFLVSGRRTKARYNVRYAELKELGYRSLVHEYYAYPENKEAAEEKKDDPAP
jgi:hypothetical protein